MKVSPNYTETGGKLKDNQRLHEVYGIEPSETAFHYTKFQRFLGRPVNDHTEKSWWRLLTDQCCFMVLVGDVEIYLMER
jgi:hypothetical protein